VTALRLELFANRFFNWRVANHRLFRSANGAVIESLPGQNVLNRFGNVRGPLDENGNIAGTDTERRFAGRISGAHQTNPAGRQNHSRLLVLHQGFGTFDRGSCHATDAVHGQALFDTCFPHHARAFVDTLRRRRMWREHHCVSGFDCDQDLEDCG
jgi:hypothetical protein